MNEKKPTLLLVDDDQEIRTQMQWALSDEYNLITAGDRQEAVALFNKERPAATLLDLGLPPEPNEPGEGMAALSEIIAIDSAAKVIIVSGQGEKTNAIEAVGAGAYDFLCKPVEMEERRVRTDDRDEPANPRRVLLHSQSRRDDGAGSSPRRKRHGQGTGCARDPSAQSAQREGLRRDQLQRNPGKPARK